MTRSSPLPPLDQLQHGRLTRPAGGFISPEDKKRLPLPYPRIKELMDVEDWEAVSWAGTQYLRANPQPVDTEEFFREAGKRWPGMMSMVSYKPGASEHAVQRFQERVRPDLDSEQARMELLALCARPNPQITRQKPDWMVLASNDRPELMVLSDDVWVMLGRSGGVRTVMVRDADGGALRRAKADLRESFFARLGVYEPAWMRKKRYNRNNDLMRKGLSSGPLEPFSGLGPEQVAEYYRLKSELEQQAAVRHLSEYPGSGGEPALP